MKQAKDLSREELERIVREITWVVWSVDAEALQAEDAEWGDDGYKFPDGVQPNDPVADPDKEWSPDQIEDVAGILGHAGLRPEDADRGKPFDLGADKGVLARFTLHNDHGPDAGCRLVADTMGREGDALRGVVLMADGYGDHHSKDGHGSPVLIEMSDGNLRLAIWGDINEESATHVVDLGDAQESARKGD
jgi:hypothetical protein